MNEELHAEVERLGITRASAEVAIHALIDLGVVSSITCMSESCMSPGVPFKSGKLNKHSISIDHIEMQIDGGSHRPENIRIVHHGCNSSWRRKRKTSEITKMKTSFGILLSRTRKLQEMVNGWDPAELEGEELAATIRTYALGMITESCEALEELKWKPWKPGDPRDHNRVDFVTEMVDVLFFFFALAAALRITPGELVDTYLEKYDENELRHVNRVLKMALQTREKMVE